MSTSIIAIARFRVFEDRLDDAVPILRRLAADSKQLEEGCLDYGCFQNQDDRLAFTTIERWRSAEDEAAHWEMDHLQNALAQLDGILDGGADVIKYHAI